MMSFEMIVIGLWGGCLLFSVWAFLFVNRLARRYGWRRRWLWNTLTGIALYLLFAWEQIPVWVVGHYYCKTQGGLTIYKTPEQWKVENPGVAETLTWWGDTTSINDKRWYGYHKQNTKMYNFRLNERFIYFSEKISNPYLPVIVSKKSIVDISNESVMVTMVTVLCGYGDYNDIFSFLKPYVGYKCSENNDENNDSFNRLKTAFAKIGKIGKRIRNGTPGNDNLSNGGDGSDVLRGGKGDDYLDGKYGDDTYYFDRGDGVDRIKDSGGDRDILIFGEGITIEQLWFKMSDSGLEISIIGTNDKVLVGWSAGCCEWKARTTEAIRLSHERNSCEQCHPERSQSTNAAGRDGQTPHAHRNGTSGYWRLYDLARSHPFGMGEHAE